MTSWPRNFQRAFLQLAQHFHAPVLPERGAFSDDPAVVSAETADRIVRQFAEETGLYTRLHALSFEELKTLADELGHPLLVFSSEEQQLRPVVFAADKKQQHDTPEHWLKDADGKIIAYSFLKLPDAAAAGEQPSGSWLLLRKLALLLRFHSGSIGHIFIYAIIVGVIGLSLPLGVQSIVSYISSGQIVTSVVVLITLIVLGLLINGGLQYMQLYIVEHLQQRIFVDHAFRVSSRLPKMQVKALHGQNPRELVNRFFDVMTIQKGTSVLLLEFSAAALQIVFGLLLISVYHPVFILPGLLLLLLLAVVLRISGPRGLSTSVKESKYKYKVVQWLEEIAGTLLTFKHTDSSRFIDEKTDHYVSHYLLARKKHFRVLSLQYFSFVLYKTIITGLLLGVGCWLVVDNKISLGQFVAAEIMIILIVGAVEKVMQKLDTIYDLLSGIDKVSQLLDVPADRNGTLPLPALPSGGLELKLTDVTVQQSDQQRPVLDHISLHVQPGESICIAGPEGSGKTSLVRLLLGAIDYQSGSFTVNGLPLMNIDRRTLLPEIGHVTSTDELYDGTLLENITLGRPGIRLQEVIQAATVAGLDSFINELPQGWNTPLVAGDQYLPGSIARKILFARCIVAKPKLVLLDNFLFGLTRTEKLRMAASLFRMVKENNAALVFVSNQEELLLQADRVVLLDDGKIVAAGQPELIRQHPALREVLQTYSTFR